MLPVSDKADQTSERCVKTPSQEKRAPSAQAGRGSSAEITTQNTELPVWVAEPALECGNTQEGVCSDKTEALMELRGCFDGKNYLKG